MNSVDAVHYPERFGSADAPMIVGPASNNRGEIAYQCRQTQADRGPDPMVCFVRPRLCPVVGEFNNEKECSEFVKIAIRSLFTGIKKGNADCEQTLKGLVNPLVDAVNTGEREKLFDTQARLIEAYRGPPLHNYVQKLCRMIRHERSPDLIKLQIELITAIEQGEYETAARADRTIMHTPLDNRAQGI